MHSAIGFVSPDDRRTGRGIAILEDRKVVYAEARQHYPQRWQSAGGIDGAW